MNNWERLKEKIQKSANDFETSQDDKETFEYVLSMMEEIENTPWKEPSNKIFVEIVPSGLIIDGYILSYDVLVEDEDGHSLLELEQNFDEKEKAEAYIDELKKKHEVIIKQKNRP